jgi:hypothetical protein
MMYYDQCTGVGRCAYLTRSAAAGVHNCTVGLVASGWASGDLVLSQTQQSPSCSSPSPSPSPSLLSPPPQPLDRKLPPYRCVHLHRTRPHVLLLLRFLLCRCSNLRRGPWHHEAEPRPSRRLPCSARLHDEDTHNHRLQRPEQRVRPRAGPTCR